MNPNHKLYPLQYLTTPRLLFVASMCPVMFTNQSTLTALAGGKPVPAALPQVRTGTGRVSHRAPLLPWACVDGWAWV